MPSSAHRDFFRERCLAMAFILRKPGSPGQFLARNMSTVKGALHAKVANDPARTWSVHRSTLRHGRLPFGYLIEFSELLNASRKVSECPLALTGHSGQLRLAQATFTENRVRR